ncbi:hypothetical protein M3Y95_00531500 [Aphelenchoides besseyi]|nr:hypothetical protein M3Y95_00531500 [Aphelenchoides besseyi]
MSSQTWSMEQIKAATTITDALTCLNIISTILSIFLIFRYSTRLMRDYRIHLVNMSVMILMCDLCATFFIRPYVILPVSAACAVGVLSSPLKKMFGVESATFIAVVLQAFFVSASLTSVTNATLHRYISIAKSQPSFPKFLSSKRNVFSFMFFIEFIWPLLTIIPALKADLAPKDFVQKNIEMYPEKMKCALKEPCFYLRVQDPIEMVNDIRYVIPYNLLIGFCIVSNGVLLVLCWKLIWEMKANVMSARTLRMQKVLLITLTAQTLIPFAVLGLCGILILIGAFFNSQNTYIFAHLGFLIGSIHSVVNFLVLLISVPQFTRGLRDDFNYIVGNRKASVSNRVFVSTSNQAFTII